MTLERRWLKVKEAAEYLGLNPKSLYRACHQKKIPCSKAPGVGVRLDRFELDAMLERGDIKREKIGK